MPSLKDFWYIAAESKELHPGQVLGVTLLGEWIALYRDADGRPTAVLDRCLHRNARLSRGRVSAGNLVCPYHGWKYGQGGQLAGIPTEGASFRQSPARCLPRFETREQEGYVYVRLGAEPEASVREREPYRLPFLGAPGYQHIRLKHIFKANVPNCAENFIDIPHTTYVHPGIFRYENAPQKLQAEVEQKAGNVHIRYRKETSNLGVFSKFLNRKGSEIFHEDNFYFPNITHVEYRMGKAGGSPRHFNIISQSVPADDSETHVYTDLTWNYGIWNFLSRPFVRWTAKKIIGQDVEIMREQTEVTQKYGEAFSSTRADLQHVWIEKIYAGLRRGEDPSLFPDRKETVEFFI